MHLKLFLIIPFTITLSSHSVLAGDSDDDIFGFSPHSKKEGFLKIKSMEHQSSDSDPDSKKMLGNSFGNSTAIPISRENTTGSTQLFSKKRDDDDITPLSQSPSGYQLYTSSFTFSPNDLRRQKKTPLALSLESGETPVFSHMQILTKEEYAKQLSEKNSKNPTADLSSEPSVASSSSTLSVIETDKEQKIPENESEKIQKQQEMNPDNEKGNSSDDEVFTMDEDL